LRNTTDARQQWYSRVVLPSYKSVETVEPSIMNTNLDTIVQEMISNWHKHSPDGCGEYFNQLVKTGKKKDKIYI
jgi:hypothetical protein